MSLDVTKLPKSLTLLLLENQMFTKVRNIRSKMRPFSKNSFYCISWPLLKSKTIAAVYCTVSFFWVFAFLDYLLYEIIIAYSLPYIAYSLQYCMLERKYFIVPNFSKKPSYGEVEDLCPN